ncbi:hypothetical protein [Methanolobus vulcani]|uniref:Uncharacterized protein n=1 Tax=Methanolobus vulcani TaxID=38026 RepID=A0A7Z8KQU9_9EURY|nr:hypothetical protein [Methanolobus vulcani]TQD28271.1 hypothetical protein FKV42_00950 [Methanolobus vulcani]
MRVIETPAGINVTSLQVYDAAEVGELEGQITKQLHGHHVKDGGHMKQILNDVFRVSTEACPDLVSTVEQNLMNAAGAEVGL